MAKWHKRPLVHLARAPTLVKFVGGNNAPGRTSGLSLGNTGTLCCPRVWGAR